MDRRTTRKSPVLRSPAVAVGVLRLISEHPRDRGRRAQDRLLDGQRRSDELDLVLEVPQNEGQLERVPRDSGGGRSSGAREAGQRLEGDLGSQGGPEVDDDVHLARPRVPGGVGPARRHDDDIAGPVLLRDAVGSESQPAPKDLEALLLARMNVVGARRPPRRPIQST
jgi:hypothetical protein